MYNDKDKNDIDDDNSSTIATKGETIAKITTTIAIVMISEVTVIITKTLITT